MQSLTIITICGKSGFISRVFVSVEEFLGAIASTVSLKLTNVTLKSYMLTAKKCLYLTILLKFVKSYIVWFLTRSGKRLMCGSRFA